MKTKTFKRIISFSLAASTMLGGVYQVGVGSSDKYVSSITAEAVEECTCVGTSDYCFNCFVEKVNELASAAKEYGVSVESKKDLYVNERYDLWFAFAYLRRLVYKSDSNLEKWGKAAGFIETDFWPFKNYLEKNHKELYNFTNTINSRTTFHINGMNEKFEIGHMCATASAELYIGGFDKKWVGVDYINQICGWAGDLQTVMNDAYKATYIDKKYSKIEDAFTALMGSDSSKFSTTDLFSDAAAHEIGKIAKDNAKIDINTLLKSCFNSTNPSDYIARFCEDISLQDVMKYTVKDTGCQFDYDFTVEDRIKVTTAFSNYLKNNYGSALSNDITITSQPTNVCGPIGGSVKTIVNASGASDLTYQWYYKNADMTDFKLSSIKTQTYDCPMTEDRVGRQIYCKIKDKYGFSVNSDIVTIGAPVEITKDITDISVKMGEKVVAKVEAKGCGLTYKWYYKNSNMSKFELTETFKGDTYTLLEMTNARNGRQIYCVVTDIFGNEVKTNTITVSGK